MSSSSVQKEFANLLSNTDFFFHNLADNVQFVPIYQLARPCPKIPTETAPLSRNANQMPQDKLQDTIRRLRRRRCYQRIVNQRHGAIQRTQRPIIARRRPHGDGRIRQYVPLQQRGAGNRRRGPDLEIHVACLRSIDQQHLGAYGSAEGGCDLENPLPGRVRGTVER